MLLETLIKYKFINHENKSDDQIPAFPPMQYTPTRHERSHSARSKINLFSSFEKEFSHQNVKQKWKIGDRCETQYRIERKWVEAEIIKIFEYENTEWLLLQCDDNKIIEIERYSECVRPMNDVLTLSQTTLNRNASTSSEALQNIFDETSMNSLLKKIQQVIDKINHKIDSSKHNFLYQVYHINTNKDKEEKKDQEEKPLISNQNLFKYVTYENDKAMKKYHEMVDSKYSSSVLCNGKILKEYGIKDLYDYCTIRAQQDYQTIACHLHLDKINKFELITKWEQYQKKYDQKWLLSVRKEEFVQIVCSKTFQIPTVQIALKLYQDLTDILKYEETTEFKCVKLSFYISYLKKMFVFH